MKRLLRYAFFVSFMIGLLTACTKKEPDEFLQTEHVPGTEVAVVNTSTPSPAVTQQAEVTTPTPAEEISPLPTLTVEEPEFMNMYRAMAAGTRVNTDGVSEEDIRHCFCELELTDRIRTALSGQDTLSLQQVNSLDGIRVLYYRNDGSLYICDVVAEATECENIMRCFYFMYQSGQKADDLTASLPETLSARGYKAEAVMVGRVQYLYIYK